MSNKKENIYDKLMVFFIALQVFGNIGGSFQPVRIFILMCVPLLFSFCLKNRSFINNYKYEIYTFCIWLIFGIISFLWVFNPTESIKEIIYLFVHFSGFVLLLFFGYKAANPKESIIKGWIWLFILTLPVVFFELVFDRHLSLSAHSADSMMNFGHGVVMQRFFASVTFGNLNGYNTILTYILPFIIGSLIIKQPFTKSAKPTGWLLLVFISLIIIINSSRAAIFCLLLAFFIYVLFNIRNAKTLLGSIILLSVVANFLLFVENQFLDFLFMRFQVSGLGDEGRSSLIFLGLNELVNTGFMGVGAADFMPTMENKYGVVNSSPHNLFLEIIVQYGIIIFILFIGLIVRILLKNRKNLVNRYKYIVIASLLILPVASIINSAYILSASIWLFLSSLLIIADKRYNLD